jgi:predicted phage terminase large subunit-like protein
VIRFAHSDGPLVPIFLEEETGASGKSNTSAFQRKRELLGFQVNPAPAEGTKEQRAIPYSTEQNKQNVWLPKDAPWLAEWIDEHKRMMGDGRRPRHDDQIDTMAYAVNYLLRFNVPSSYTSSDEALERAGVGVGGFDVEQFFDEHGVESVW